MAAASPWHFHFHPSVWVVIATVAIAYVYAIKRVGPLRVGPDEPVVTRHQATAFSAGLLVMWIGADWPIHDLAERWLYSVHMLQHLLFAWVAVPLIYIGLPAWMIRAALPRGSMRFVRAITRPLPALVIFNGVLVLTHWPAMVDASVSSELAHFGLHLALVASAFVMWTPVLSPLLELPRLSYPGRMLFLFLQSLVPTVPASFLTFGSHPLYHVYETFPRLGGISALTDQRVSGLIMKILGGFLLWGLIAVQFFRWYALEHRTEGLDLLDWRDVDRDLNRVNLTRP